MNPYVVKLQFIPLESIKFTYMTSFLSEDFDFAYHLLKKVNEGN